MFDDNTVFCLLIKRRKEPSSEEKENILVVLTNDGYLKVMSADTGFVLRSIFLSTIIKFRSVLTSRVHNIRENIVLKILLFKNISL